MKLEEVLPAMRAGMVAIGPDGYRYRIAAEAAEWQNLVNGLWLSTRYIPVKDGWTLEPEPKVEWPKGSLGWAKDQAKPDGSVRRHGLDWSQPVSTIDMSFIRGDCWLALDWEVVP